MRRKIDYKVISSIIILMLCSVIIVNIAFSSMCLTWLGTVVLIIVITLAGYSALYLIDKYEKISANDRKIELADNKNKKLV